MKKILLLMCVAVVAVFAFASCSECEHPLSEEWYSDADGHWHPTSCEHGEFRSESVPHVDANEDGICDVCSYKGEHIHTFSDEWTIDEDKHWKKATCSHTDLKSEESLHTDEDLNGECDACKTHVHILDGAGFCAGCNKVIDPVEEDDIGSVISATTARTHNVVSSIIDYSQIGRMANEEAEIKHLVEYTFGTNGTYSKRSYDEVNDNGVPTGKTEILEKWITKLTPVQVNGVTTISVDGVYKEAFPSDFAIDDLKGDYYGISTLADGYCPEELLLSLYKVYEKYKTEEAVIAYDADANTYDFDFKALVVSKTETLDVSTLGSQSETVYTAHYYEVSISFTYADDYTLKSFEITCDCWTSDAGNSDTEAGKEEIDIEYYPETNTFAFVQYDAESQTFVPATERPRADTYTVSGTQTIGTREEIELNDGSQFKPTTFEIYTDKQLTTPLGDPITLDVTDIEEMLYVSVAPEGTFISFFKYEFETIVTDKNGNRVYGFNATFIGDNILMMPLMAGEYHVTFKALGIEKTVDVTVTAPELRGEGKFTVEVLESYAWSDEWNNEEGVYYEFTATNKGVYTFYLPPHLGIVETSKWDKNGTPDFDPTGRIYDEEENLFRIKLDAGEVYRFYVMGAAVGTYTIGYNAP